MFLQADTTGALQNDPGDGGDVAEDSSRIEPGNTHAPNGDRCPQG